MQVVSFYGLLDDYHIPGISRNKSGISRIPVYQEYRSLYAIQDNRSLYEIQDNRSLYAIQDNKAGFP